MSQLSPKCTGWCEVADGIWWVTTRQTQPCPVRWPMAFGGSQHGTHSRGSVTCAHPTRPAAVLCPWYSKGTWPWGGTLLHTQGCPDPRDRDTEGCFSCWILDLPFDSHMVQIWMGLMPVPACSRVRLKSCSYSGESCWLIPSPERTVPVTGG